MSTACQPTTRLFGILLDSFINYPVPVQTALLKSVVWVWKKLNIPQQLIKCTVHCV